MTVVCFFKVSISGICRGTKTRINRLSSPIHLVGVTRGDDSFISALARHFEISRGDTMRRGFFCSVSFF